MTAEDMPIEMETAQPEMEGAAEETVNESTPAAPATESKKRSAAAGGDKERLAVRPRWGEKPFQDITMGDVETLVRKCNALEKQVEANKEAADHLKEAQKREKDLEKQLEEFGPKEIALVKASIAKQFLAQMHYFYAWNDDLKGSGREVQAFLPNVSLELLKALGGDLNQTKTKHTQVYFDKVPSKILPLPITKAEKEAYKAETPGGNALVLGGLTTLKYVKTSRELQLKAFYKFGVCERKPKGRGRGKAKNTEGDAEEAFADEFAEDGEGAADEDHEEEAVDGAAHAVACENGGA